jgi:hypothetical protein
MPFPTLDLTLEDFFAAVALAIWSVCIVLLAVGLS